MKRRTLIAWCPVIFIGWCGCAGTPDAGDQDAALDQAVLRGELSVLPRADRTRLSEREPNDDPTAQQSAAAATMGGRIEVLGTLASPADADALRISASEPLQVTAVLSFEFAPSDTDFALGLVDDRAPTCATVHGVELSACFDGQRNPESASFGVDHDFVIVVHSMRGAGNYVLGLEFTPQRAAGAYRAGEILVQFDDGLSLAQCAARLQGWRLRLARRAPCGVCLVHCPGAGPEETQHLVEVLRQRPHVRWCEPNALFRPAMVPDDEHFALQWHYELINLPQAWERTVGAADTLLAVVDTGIIPDHPELSGRLGAGFDFISDVDSARDGDGPDADPTDEGDLAGGPGLSSYHGLHVAGTLAAATNNERGIAGVTWQGQVLPLRALGADGGTAFDIAEAIRFSAALPNISGQVPPRRADVVNLSVAGTPGAPSSQVMGAAIKEAYAAGVVLVAAAGNDASSEATYPGAFSEVIAVSACDPQMNLAPYSNTGPHIGLSAPGGDLALDLNGDGFGDGILSLSVVEDGSQLEPVLSLQQGTSMAAPHVSGVVALMRAVNPQLDPDDIRGILQQTARDVGDPGTDHSFGAGVLDAARAVQEAAARAGQPPPTEPQLRLSAGVLDFGSASSTLRVHVANTGGGLLEITDLSTQEWIGTGWLRSHGEGVTEGASVAAVVVTVDRTALQEGRYRGRVEVQASGQQTQAIDVSMTVGDTPLVDEDIFVVAVDAFSRASVAQTVTRAQNGFRFEISLPAGTYKVYAGTDRNDDGLICDLGELCGAQPSAIRATDVTVSPAEVFEGIDFAVGELIFQPASMSRGELPPGACLSIHEPDRARTKLGPRGSSGYGHRP